MVLVNVAGNELCAAVAARIPEELLHFLEVGGLDVLRQTSHFVVGRSELLQENPRCGIRDVSSTPGHRKSSLVQQCVGCQHALMHSTGGESGAGASCCRRGLRDQASASSSVASFRSLRSCASPTPPHTNAQSPLNKRRGHFHQSACVNAHPNTAIAGTVRRSTVKTAHGSTYCVSHLCSRATKSVDASRASLSNSAAVAWSCSRNASASVRYCEIRSRRRFRRDAPSRSPSAGIPIAATTEMTFWNTRRGYPALVRSSDLPPVARGYNLSRLDPL